MTPEDDDIQVEAWCMRSQASGCPSPPSPQLEYIGVAFVHKPGGPALPRSFSGSCVEIWNTFPRKSSMNIPMPKPHSIYFPGKNIVSNMSIKLSGDTHEHRIIGHMSSDADPLSEAIDDMAFVLCVWRTRCESSVRVEMTRRVELSRIVTIYSGVLVAQPNIHDTRRSLGNEHALVPVVLERTMGDPNGQT